MFKLKSALIPILFFGVALVAHAESTDKTQETAMTPPKPAQNKVYDALAGTWQGTSDMHGKKMHEVMKARWALNHQYLILEVKGTSVDNPKMKYEGMGIFGLDKDGNARTFWFDSWGGDAAATGTGTFGDNKLELSDSNAQFKETRTLEVKGKEMVMHAKGTMTRDGKEMPFEVTTVYKKK